MTTAGLSQYQTVNSFGQLDGASPYRVTQLMLDTLATRIAEAEGHVARSETEAKGIKIAKAIGLVEGLVMSLDIEQGGEIARNLQDLYDYLLRGLVEANLDNSVAKLREIGGIVAEIKAGWDGIGTEAGA